MKKKIFIFTFVGIFSFVSYSFKDNFFEVSKNLDIFASLYKELNTYYVDDVDPSKLMKEGIDAMLNSLDPYTNFISEAEIEDFRFQTTGKYGGIGAVISQKNGQIIINEPYEGFPAFKSGMRAGDILLEVEGKNMEGMSTEEVSKRLKGEPGTQVKIKIKRPGIDEVMAITLTREEIKVDNVPYAGMVNDSIAYIKLNSFTENAGKAVRKGLEKLKASNELKGVIFDLRGNPGGLLNEAVNVSNVFIPKGQEIVSTKGKIEDWDKTYNTSRQAVDTDVPLAILTNSSSASASEIVAGAAQDLDRGVVIGEKTFGKGLVQTTRPLSYNTQLKITTAKYFIPSGRGIQAIDYAHRKDDGSIGKIPDSLKSAFKTKNGRTVYDGGGIRPDIETEEEKLGKITISLLSKQLIFDYVTLFRNKHDTIVTPDKFKITDQDYEEFVAFLSDKEYDYVTRSEKQLEELAEVTKKEKYYDAIKDELEEMQKKMMHDKEKDLQKYKDQIREIIESEIVSRYYFQEGRIVASFDDDTDINEAVRLFQDMNRYYEILNIQHAN